MKPTACGWRHKGQLSVTGETATIRTVHYICFVLFVDRFAVWGFISWLVGRHRYSLLCSWRSEYCAHILRDWVTGLMGISIAGLRQCLCELAGTRQFYDHFHAVLRKFITPILCNIVWKRWSLFFFRCSRYRAPGIRSSWTDCQSEILLGGFEAIERECAKKTPRIVEIGCNIMCNIYTMCHTQFRWKKRCPVYEGPPPPKKNRIFFKKDLFTFRTKNT